jgi:lysophospholipase L1-like esterase
MIIFSGKLQMWVLLKIRTIPNFRISMRVFWRILLFACLLAALVVGRMLFQFFQEIYLEEQLLRLDPFELRQFTQANDSLSPKQEAVPRVLLFGDSRAESWTSPELEGVEVLNRGIGGQTTAQLLGRMEADVLALEPDVVVLQAGVNDLKTMAFFPGRADSILIDCKTNLREVVRICRESGAQVVITTIFPVGNIEVVREQLFWSDAVEAGILSVNADLNRLAQSDSSLWLFDTRPLLAEEGNKVLSRWQKNFLHLNIYGYQQLNQSLEPLLAEILYQGTPRDD